MWVYTKTKGLVNLAAAAEMVIAHDDSEEWTLKAVFPGGNDVVLAQSSDQSEVDSIKNRLYQFLKQGTTTCDLRFS
ncbi:MAG: hypothetical protein LC772_03805 [Chloroflexi bacterium]|nr:hypothetical protein [Chloroflexota bacterium]